MPSVDRFYGKRQKVPLQVVLKRFMTEVFHDFEGDDLMRNSDKSLTNSEKR
jgi:hypothetical protein